MVFIVKIKLFRLFNEILYIKFEILFLYIKIIGIWRKIFGLVGNFFFFYYIGKKIELTYIYIY